jgi:hypothetical protein
MGWTEIQAPRKCYPSAIPSNSYFFKDLVSVDESSINHQDIKEYAWSERGVKVIGERSGAVRHRRMTVIARICLGKCPVLLR